MKPGYAEAAKILKDEKIDGILAALDATTEKAIAERLDVKGFPTLKYFQNGKLAWNFNDRTRDGIVAFMKEYVIFYLFFYIYVFIYVFFMYFLLFS